MSEKFLYPAVSLHKATFQVGLERKIIFLNGWWSNVHYKATLWKNPCVNQRRLVLNTKDFQYQRKLAFSLLWCLQSILQLSRAALFQPGTRESGCSHPWLLILTQGLQASSAKEESTWRSQKGFLLLPPRRGIFLPMAHWPKVAGKCSLSCAQEGEENVVLGASRWCKSIQALTLN